jgi:hypothetical protein
MTDASGVVTGLVGVVAGNAARPDTTFVDAPLAGATLVDMMLVDSTLVDATLGAVLGLAFGAGVGPSSSGCHQ